MSKKWKILNYFIILFIVALAAFLCHSSSAFAHELKDPATVLILQLIVVVASTRLFGYICIFIGQPSVIGQIIAGIVLGPSLLGFVFPEFFGFLFSPQSLTHLKLLSTLGLIFFMFIVGMELDLNMLKNKAKHAIAISNAGIVFPFILGVLLSFSLYKSYGPSSVNFISFALFMGVAMSITAFPVLARIVQERNILKTHVGSLALICAAIDDVTAWCMLVTVIAVVTASSVYAALLTLVLAILYVLLMVKVVRPSLQKFSESYNTNEKMHNTLVTVFFLMLLTSACITKLIGIHELFGAFMAGIVMPQNISFKKLLTEKIEDVSLVLLLPLFFVFSGLRTHIGLLNGLNEWMICALVIITAIAGKFGGCFIASRLVGESWKNSLSIGILMNTRGLVELIVLNIGLELKILEPKIFTIMVIMALVTTFLTNPGLSFIDKIFKNWIESWVIILKKTNLFTKFNDLQYSDLVSQCSEVKIKRGTILFQEGDVGNVLYIIKEGTIQVYTLGKGNEEIILAALEKGSYFGEQALLTDSPGIRNAAVRALSDCILLKIRHDVFLRIIEIDKSLKKELEEIGFHQLLVKKNKKLI